MGISRQEAEKKIIDFITDICAGDKRNVDIYKDAFSKMNDKQFREYMQGIKDGTKKLTLQAPNFDNSFINMENLQLVAKKYKFNLYEKLWVTPEDGGPTYLTPPKYLIIKVPVRRQAQLLVKKISIPENNRVVDKLSGQPTGPSKGAKISLPETQILDALNLPNTLLELLKIRGGDEGAFRAYNTSISRTGYASQAELANYATGVDSTATFAAIMTACHYKTTGLDNK